MGYNKIPIVVVLWENTYFRGRRAVLTEDAPSLWPILGFWYNEIRVSSIGIHPGPDYDPNADYEVSFYSGWSYMYSQLVLTPGEYPDLRYPYNFDNKISSVKFNTGIPAAPKIEPIPVVGELYGGINFIGKKLVVLENVKDFEAYAGFEDFVSSAKVFQGPNYARGDKLILHRDRNYIGGEIALAPGEYPNLASSHGFDNIASSAKVNPELP